MEKRRRVLLSRIGMGFHFHLADQMKYMVKYTVQGWDENFYWC